MSDHCATQRTTPKCVVFDFGNVIAFFSHMHACRELAALSKSDSPKTADQIHKAVFELRNDGETTLEERYDTGQITTREFFAELKQLLGIPDSPENDIELTKAWCEIFRPNQEVVAVILELAEARSYRLVLASNTNELHYGQIREKFPEVLDLFNAQVLSFQIKRRKPDSEFFKRCITEAACRPEECVYVDDRAEFVKKAQEEGMHGITYIPSESLRESMECSGIRFGGILRPSALLQGVAKDVALQIYQQKYLQYRHLDTLRWQIPGLVATIGAIILSLGSDKAKALLPYLLCGYGAFALLCWYFLGRITYHHVVNQRALRRVGELLGDWTIPPSTSAVRRWISAAFWFRAFVLLIGCVSLVACLVITWDRLNH